MSTQNSRNIKLLSVSNDHTVFIRFQGSSDLMEMKALEVKQDNAGNIEYMILDRKIHSNEEMLHLQSENKIVRSFSVSGAYVTELRST